MTDYIQIMKSPWKFESNEKLGSKISSPSNSPIPNAKNDSFPPPEKAELESITLQPEEKMSQKGRRGKGLVAKMKMKVQQQLKSVYKQIQERQSDLSGLTAEVEALGQALRERRRVGEDLINNEQMFQFKEKQLSNLMTIHAELLQGAKKDILNEKNTKFSHEQKIVSLKKRIAEFNSRAMQRQHLSTTASELAQEKIRLEQQLRARKQTEAKKNLIRSEATREMLQQLVRRNRRELEDQCEKKVRIVREASSHIKRHSDLRKLLQAKGITPSDYYTFGQLKYVQQLNFRAYPQSEKVMRIFYKEVNPKIPEIIEHYEQPAEFIKLKEELASLEKIKIEKDTQMKKRQVELERVEEENSKLKKSIADLKMKTQIK